MIRSRGGSLSAPLEDADMLEEILVRLPPQPSSLPRASAVCHRWRGLLTDPRFLRRFNEHHREPPLLGVFFDDGLKIEFAPVLPAPDRIPPRRLGIKGRLLGCRHGRVLILRWEQAEILVCDPITGDQQCVPIPPEFNGGYVNGAVLCAASDQSHVHGSCHSTPFKVVLLLMCAKDNRPLASVYSSESDTWGDAISTEVSCPDCIRAGARTLVGKVLYWSFMYAKEGIIGFDFERQSLDVLEGPPGMNSSGNHQIIQAEDGAVGLAMLSNHYHNIQVWRRKVNCHSGANWVLSKTIEMHKILGLAPQFETQKACLKFMRGYVEDIDGVLLYVKGSVYMVQLKSLQSRKLCEAHNCITCCHPFQEFRCDRWLFIPGPCIVAVTKSFFILFMEYCLLCHHSL
ncbi:hypothetical protein VPH35_126886 [Triticum aestivum]